MISGLVSDFNEQCPELIDDLWMEVEQEEEGDGEIDPEDYEDAIVGLAMKIAGGDETTALAILKHPSCVHDFVEPVSAASNIVWVRNPEVGQREFKLA